MISFIKGKLYAINGDYIDVEVGGMGYQIAVTEKTINRLPLIGAEVFLHTHLQVLENEFKLYGFLNKEELNLFLKITAVSGMGARAGLNIIGTLSPEEFYQAIIAKDEKTLTRIQGIGKKSAQRLLFEFKDKVDAVVSAINVEEYDKHAFGEILDAMEALGYERNEIMPFLLKMQANNELHPRIEDNIKTLLRYFAKTIQ